MKRVGFVPGHLRNVLIRLVLNGILVLMLHSGYGITTWPFLSMVLAALSMSERYLLTIFDGSELMHVIEVKKLGLKELEKKKLTVQAGQQNNNTEE